MRDIESDNFITELDVEFFSTETKGSRHEKRQVIREDPLTIEIKDIGTYTLMCTPSDKLAMAVGFAFTEGLISSVDDINVLMKCPDDPQVIRMQLAEGKNQSEQQRNLLIVSSCGICGSENIKQIIEGLPKVTDSLRISNEELSSNTKELWDKQETFKKTGASHAVGLMRSGDMLAMGEDIGRHNAFDKAIGICLLKRIPTAGTLAVLSGRVSFELAVKAARAGVELIAAVSAPTTLAIEVADNCNITLCGFVRGKDATVYCHPHRITSPV